MEEPILNAHNKEEYPPMHTAEHILNGTMVKMFGCPRSRNAHIERKKSKCDYLLPCCPTDEQVAQLEAAVNEVIGRHLDVTIEFMPREQALRNWPVAGQMESTVNLNLRRGGTFWRAGLARQRQTGAKCLVRCADVELVGAGKMTKLAEQKRKHYSYG